jgi:hypothetical protein
MEILLSGAGSRICQRGPSAVLAVVTTFRLWETWFCFFASFAHLLNRIRAEAIEWTFVFLIVRLIIWISQKKIWWILKRFYVFLRVNNKYRLGWAKIFLGRVSRVPRRLHTATPRRGSPVGPIEWVSTLLRFTQHVLRPEKTKLSMRSDYATPERTEIFNTTKESNKENVDLAIARGGSRDSIRAITQRPANKS